MPELPEIETVQRSLLPRLKGHCVTDVIFRRKNLRWPFPLDVAQYIQNKVILDVTRRSKYLLVHFETGTLIIHLGMSGSLRWIKANEPLQKHDHFDLVIDQQHAVRLNDPRRFGAVLWQDGEEPHKVLQDLGPEPLTRIFQGKMLHQRLQYKKTPIKVALMDPRVVVGVGNIYATEALFRARIDPRKEAQRLTMEECKALVQEVKYVLKKGIEMGGSTLRNFHGLEGQVGTFASNSLVYGKAQKPCPVCQKSLSLVVLGGRATVFCEKCQH